MRLSLYPYQLQFKFPFRIAHGLRIHTDVVYVKLEHEKYTVWGEAALPPYLPETQESVIAFLNKFSRSLSHNSSDDCFERLQFENENLSAKAALDMALWDLKAQTEGKSIGELLGIAPINFPQGTYTLGVSSAEEMEAKVKEATKAGFEIFKLKLDGKQDEEMVRSFRLFCNKPFAADVNQGWETVEKARRKIDWLKEEGCFLVEQPLSKDAWTEMRYLKQNCPLPLYADESCQRLSDLERVAKCFDGVNIKLMKCGGITEARQMILKARELGLKVLIGCMSESSVGCTAAAHLTPLADYADLDGPYLIANDPFDGMKVVNGKIQINPLRSKEIIP